MGSLFFVCCVAVVCLSHVSITDADSFFAVGVLKRRSAAATMLMQGTFDWLQAGDELRDVLSDDEENGGEENDEEDSGDPSTQPPPTPPPPPPPPPPPAVCAAA